MHFGIVITRRDPRDFAELAVRAEQAGWDAVFSWETLYGLDPWVGLTAAALRTTTVRVGTMLTPMTKYKPWHLASVAATLDQLSGGRVILSVGLGSISEGWTAYEPDPGRKMRAELTDEGLDVMFGLWAHGGRFAYDGNHFSISPTTMFVPPQSERPRHRVTTWCVGLHGAPRSMRRAARCDGLLPNFRGPEGITEAYRPDVAGFLAAAAEVVELRESRGLRGPYDIVVENDPEPHEWGRAADEAAALCEGGYTWYIDSSWNHVGAPDEIDRIKERIDLGPPRLHPTALTPGRDGR